MLNPDCLIPFAADQYDDAVPIYPVRRGQLGAIPADDKNEPHSGEDIPALLADQAKRNGFSGKLGDVFCGEHGILVGIDSGHDPFAIAAASETLGAGTYRLAGSWAQITLPALSTFQTPEANTDGPTPLILLGWLLGGYQFARYKKAAQRPALLMADDGIDVIPIRQQAEATALVRDLVNTSAGDLLPGDLEAAARSVADIGKATGRSTLDVIDGNDLLDKNFPMVHAVGRAASESPRLVDIRWTPDTKTNAANLKSITLVGKGVCFDSGGLNIKGAGGMGLMKKDMGGAAHALGLAQMIMAAQLPVRLRILLPIVENAISGNAFRPGDVLPSRKGLTVEIGNTDAEGRLILADAMTYGAEENPDLMISLATLTGAARVALGPEVIPFYTDDSDLAQAISMASDATYDPAWHLPMWDRYEPMLSSPVADLNNISGNSFAGSMIAALFLRRFIPADQSWLHFDVYAWRPKTDPGRPHGGDAQCIRAIFDMIKNQLSNQ